MQVTYACFEKKHLIYREGNDGAGFSPVEHRTRAAARRRGAPENSVQTLTRPPCIDQFGGETSPILGFSDVSEIEMMPFDAVAGGKAARA